MTTNYKYVGDGDFVQGVPARNLTKAEWEQLPKELQKLALKLGLYETAKAVGSQPTDKEQ